MKLGFNEPKKLVVLGVLVAGGVYLKFADAFSSTASGTAAPAAAVETRPADPPEAAPPPVRPQRARIESEEFHPVLRSKRPEDRIDPAKVDPTLRLDLLAKLQRVDVDGPERNLFQFGAAPPKALPPEPKVIPKPVPVNPAAAAAAAAALPATPPPLRIPLRYYGYSAVNAASAKTAFFLDGDDILVAKEGETLKRRYRVVKIGATSVVMEDTESKQEQSIPMEPITG